VGVNLLRGTARSTALELDGGGRLMTAGAVDLMGDRVRVRIDGTPTVTAEVTPAAVDALNLDAGGQLWAAVEPSAIHPYAP
jgi:molybdopterin-binding protein